MDQASFHCPQCQQMRLFQSKPMNHTPHLLAAIFLCGIWLPIWAILALSDKPQWHCAFCGFSAQQKYLQDPTLFAREQAWKAQKAAFAASVREDRGNDQTFGERVTYFVEDRKRALITLGVIAGVLGVIIIAATAWENDRQAKLDAWRASQTPTPTVTPRPSLSPTPKKRN